MALHDCRPSLTSFKCLDTECAGRQPRCLFFSAGGVKKLRQVAKGGWDFMRGGRTAAFCLISGSALSSFIIQLKRVSPAVGRCQPFLDPIGYQLVNETSHSLQRCSGRAAQVQRNSIISSGPRRNESSGATLRSTGAWCHAPCWYLTDYTVTERSFVHLHLLIVHSCTYRCSSIQWVLPVWAAVCCPLRPSQLLRLKDITPSGGSKIELHDRKLG